MALAVVALAVGAVAVVLVGGLPGESIVEGVAVPTSPRAVASAAAGDATSTPSLAADPLHVVGLGDSVMAGTNCGCEGIVAGYSARVAQSERRTVRATNLGSDGETTQDLLTALADDRGTRDAVASADTVLVIVGANDLLADDSRFDGDGCDTSCYESDVMTMGQQLGEALDRISALSQRKDLRVLVGGYWNVYPDGSVAEHTRSTAERDFDAAVTTAANAEISAEARDHRATYVDLVTPFKGNGSADPTSLLAPDGDHPNAAGVAAIVNAYVRSAA
jgi:lysophospholipase L1-like esterase